MSGETIDLLLSPDGDVIATTVDPEHVVIEAYDSKAHKGGLRVPEAGESHIGALMRDHSAGESAFVAVRIALSRDKARQLALGILNELS